MLEKNESEQAVASTSFAALQARATKAGHTLTAVPGGYMLSRWSHSKHCADLATVEGMLQRMGAKP